MTRIDAPSVPRITVVHAEACHFCTEANSVLEEMAEETPLEVRGVSVDSEEGRALVARHRPAMSPLVLLDGEFFSQGRLPRRKLAKALRTRAAERV